MKAINGFWDFSRSETPTGAGFKFRSSVNESFTDKIVSKELGSGCFCFGPSLGVQNEIKEFESGRFSFGPSQSIPIKFKDLGSGEFYVEPAPSTPNKIKESGPCGF